MRYLLLPLFVLLLSASAASATAELQDTPETTLYTLLSAEFSIYRQHYDQALNFYLSAMRKHPEDAAIAERATRLALYDHQYADMLEAAKIWQKADQSHSQSAFFSSLAYAFNGQANVALDTMLHVLHQGGQADFARLISLQNLDKNQQDFYLNSLFQAAHEQPKNANIALALAMLYAQQDNQEKALAYLKQANQLSQDKTDLLNYGVAIYLQYQQVDAVLALYHTVIQQNPDDLSLREDLLRIANQFAPQEALVQLNFLLEQRRDDANLLLNKALIQIKLKQLEAAQKPLNRLLALRQREDSAHYYLALIHFYQQDETAALAEFLNVKQGHEYPSAVEYIVRIYIKQQLYSEALNRVDQALARSDLGDKTPFYLLKAHILEQQGHLKEAYQLLSSVLEKQPNSIDLRYNRAMLAQLNNQLPQMESDLRYILSIDPDSAMTLNALGYTLTNHSKRYDEALKLIQKAHDLLPEDPAILDSLGWVLYHLGHSQQALVYLKKALQIYSNAEVASHLGEVLWATGQKQQALDVFRDALKKDPDNPYLNQTIKRLNVSL